MESNTWWDGAPTRRRFMAFGVAGAVPFLAGGRRLFAQRAMIGSVRPQTDPVVEEISREMARLHTSIRQRGLRAEHVHGIGAQVRVMLAHARAIDMDARVQSGIGAAIDRKGRETLINTEVDQRAITAGLKAIGMDVADHTPIPMVTREEKAKMLDELLVGGLTPHLERLERAIAQAEIAADRSSSDPLEAAHISTVQCALGWRVIEAEMEAAAMFFGWFAPEIAAWFWGAYFGCEIMELFLC